MKLSAALAAAVLAAGTTTALPAVAEAVAEAAAAVLAATTTALPAVAEAAAAPPHQNWGMPIINHIPVPGAGRRSSPAAALDKVTTTDNVEDDDDDDLDGFTHAVKRRDDDVDDDDDDDDALDDHHGSGSAVHHHRRDDHDHDHDDDLDGFDSVERRAGGRGKGGGDIAHPKPIALTLTHPKTIPDDGRGIEKSDFENFGEELMRRAGRHRPIVDHTPVERRGRRADAGKPVADAFWGMPVVDHVPVPDTRREVAAAAELESRREPFPIVDHKPSEP
ncbi:hypothetical protein BM221_010398 [Beauveria bassiana]|uniref:Uncharacterized protein n=1 Tax=Beauveria bassiana TaxID=176275 RepID=A0A2N6N8Q1_BEABA|nr:hypothetical protein BM221_010398 [Beauveria bassiana]